MSRLRNMLRSLAYDRREPPRHSEHLPSRTTLLLYTDGLVERPGEDIGNSLHRPRQHAAAPAREPVDVLCDERPTLAKETRTTSHSSLHACPLHGNVTRASTATTRC
ncbi:SpoIIE family protein phosphatase [Streptomyces sp. NPDC002835]|jgi:hypothetical protein